MSQVYKVISGTKRTRLLPVGCSTSLQEVGWLRTCLVGPRRSLSRCIGRQGGSGCTSLVSRKTCRNWRGRTSLCSERSPRHPSFQFKKVGKFRSVQVGLAHRALAIEDGNRRLTQLTFLSSGLAWWQLRGATIQRCLRGWKGRTVRNSVVQLSIGNYVAKSHAGPLPERHTACGINELHALTARRTGCARGISVDPVSGGGKVELQ